MPAHNLPPLNSFESARLHSLRRASLLNCLVSGHDFSRAEEAFILDVRADFSPRGKHFRDFFRNALEARLSFPVLSSNGRLNHHCYYSDEGDYTQHVHHGDHHRSQPEARARSMGPGDVRHHRDPAHRAHARLRRLRQRQQRTRRHLHPHRHGRHGLHRHQLRTHGARLSQRRLGLHLCRPRDPSRARLRHRLEHDHGLHDQPAHLHHLVRQGHGRSSSPKFRRACWFVAFAVLFTAAEPARRRNLRAHQPGAVRGHGRGDRRVLRRHHALPLSIGPAYRGVLPQPFYNPQAFSPARDIAWNVTRRAHLHRLRRHLHALRRSAQPASATFCWQRCWSASSPACSRRPKSTRRNCCVPDTDSPKPKPSAPSRTSRPLPAASRSRWPSPSRCLSRRSARAWERNWARRACSTAWDAATPSPNRSSERSIRAPAFRATTSFSSASSRWWARSSSATTIARAELLNYGALIAFMGVNIASLTHYFIRGNDRLSQPAGSDCGLRHLRRAVVEPLADGADRRLHLDVRRRSLRRLEDPRLPGGPGATSTCLTVEILRDVILSETARTVAVQSKGLLYPLRSSDRVPHSSQGAFRASEPAAEVLSEVKGAYLLLALSGDFVRRQAPEKGIEVNRPSRPGE